MSDFLFLHISDLHLCEIANRINALTLMGDPPAHSLHYREDVKFYPTYPSSFDRDLANAAAAFIDEVGSDYDAIILSGDLATTGLYRDLEVGEFFLNAKEARPYNPETFLRPIGSFADKVLFLPGNHDRYKDSYGQPWSFNLEIKIKNHWSPKKMDVNYRIFENNGHQIAIFLVDFSLRCSADAEAPIAINRYGRGKAYHDTMERLTAEVAIVRNTYKNIKIAWATHYPAGIKCQSYLSFIDEEHFISCAYKHNVSFILAGHLHRSEILCEPQQVPVLCAGTLCSIDQSPESYAHSIEINVSQDSIWTLQRHDFRWNKDDQDLMHVSSSLPMRI